MTDDNRTDGNTDSNTDSSQLEVAQEIVSAAIDRGISRRALMLAAAAGVSGAAVGGLGGRASAASPSDASGTVYFEQIGDASNPVQEVHINNQFVQDQQNSISVDDIGDNGSGAVSFTAPLSGSTATISSTFTDPSGTSHAGELADAADVVSDHSNLSGVASDQHHAQLHGNGDHTSTYVADGDGTDREIFVINNGASDPSAAGADDIILERE